MTLNPFGWQNNNPATPLSAAELEAFGLYIANYFDNGISTKVPSLGTAFNGTLLGGTGDNITNQLASPATGQFLEFAQGTAASPDTTLNPILKVNRSLSVLNTAVTGDGGEQLTAIHGITKGDAATQNQTVGVLGSAQNSGSAKGSSNSPDACAIYGLGRILNSGIGVGIGGFFRGQADTSNGLMTGTQIQTYNNTGRTDAVVTAGFSKSVGEWMWAAGPNQSAVGWELGNPFSQQFDVGLHFNGQTPAAGRVDPSCGTTSTLATVTDTSCVATDKGAVVTGTGVPTGTIILSVTPGVSFVMSQSATATNNPVSLTIQQTGPTITADIVSDSAALTGILVKGTHNIGINVPSGTNPVVIGGSSKTSTAYLEVVSNTAVRPIANFGGTTAIGNIGV
jgi:hypothetical protein